MRKRKAKPDYCSGHRSRGSRIGLAFSYLHRLEVADCNSLGSSFESNGLRVLGYSVDLNTALANERVTAESYELQKVGMRQAITESKGDLGEI